MSKVGLIISREYFSRVRKKSFLLTTILVPLVIIGFYAAIIVISLKGSDEKKSIAVVDQGQLFSGKIESKESTILLTLIPNETEPGFVNKYKSKGYDAFLYIPPFSLDSPRHFTIHSQSSLSLSASGSIEHIINKAIEDKRLTAQGIDPKKYAAIQSDISIENTIDTKEGGKKSVAAVAYADRKSTRLNSSHSS